MIGVFGLRARAGDFVLDGATLEVPTGGYALLMGRTGSGKTTLLEAICGLRPIEAGRVVLMEREVTDLPPSERGIGLVPQDGVLFRTMSVFENLAFGLRTQRRPEAEVRLRVDELATLLSVGHLLGRRAVGLSGGEAQRIALGRALAMRPRLLCLDEPLSALDAETRQEMIALLAAVRTQTGVTTLHITHELRDTRLLADRLFVLEQGRVIERPLIDTTGAVNRTGTR